MRPSTALNRYLQHYIEPDLPAAPRGQLWQHVLVIPAYRERSKLLERLANLRAGNGRLLIVLVLNRPDSDSDNSANAELRVAITAKLSPIGSDSNSAPDSGTLALNTQCDLYLLDLEQQSGASPADQGVGLARKTGCDLAIQWMHEGAISSDWVYCTDADATLPEDYFERLSTRPDKQTAVAAALPFMHTPTGDARCDRATALYERQLHHYVLGLEYAASPYAYHTLGSSLAITADAYVKVRGVPKRAGGEDFYLLNKVAKLGHIAKPGGRCIGLESRASVRVPFGTGPAVTRIMNSQHQDKLALFYHPACFHALRTLLAGILQLYEQADRNTSEDIFPVNFLLPENELLDETLTAQTGEQLLEMGIVAALAHCRRQSSSAEQFMRQFHQWFDGFRTLKFIHGMCDRGWPRQSFEELQNLQPQLWPIGGDNACSSDDDTQLKQAIMEHWNWTPP